MNKNTEYNRGYRGAALDAIQAVMESQKLSYTSDKISTLEIILGLVKPEEEPEVVPEEYLHGYQGGYQDATLEAIQAIMQAIKYDCEKLDAVKAILGIKDKEEEAEIEED